MTNGSGRRALVAGGAGFLGSHLCELLLAQGMEVTCLDSLLTGNRANLARIATSPGFHFVEADISRPLPRGLAAQRFDEIYNLACAASPPAYQRDPEHTLLTSVLGTRELLLLAERCGGRLLLASTSEIYGDPDVHPQVESYHGNVNPIGPRACYDEGKRAAETLAFDYERLGRASVRVARIFNTYGPRLDRHDGRVVSNLIVQAIEERPLTLYGDGTQTRSFCYVDDLVAGLVALMRHAGPQPGPVNLGNPAEVTVLELAQRIAHLARVPLAIVHRPLPVDDPRRRRPDVGRAEAVLGWRPQVPLHVGLVSTMAWFRGQIPARPLRPTLCLRPAPPAAMPPAMPAVS